MHRPTPSTFAIVAESIQLFADSGFRLFIQVTTESLWKETLVSCLVDKFRSAQQLQHCWIVFSSQQALDSGAQPFFSFQCEHLLTTVEPPRQQTAKGVASARFYCMPIPCVLQ